MNSYLFSPRRCARSRAFTLIEILVVISIISLTASLVLASLKTAQEKATASSITSQVRQYLLALELYRDDHNGYPAMVVSGSNGSCLGAGYPGGKCGWINADQTPTSSAAPENPAFNAALAPYISSQMRFNFGPVSWDGPDYWQWRGAYYFCVPVAGACTDAAVVWWVPGGTESCRIPGTLRFTGMGMTGCQYVLQGNPNPNIVNPQ